MVDDGLRMSRNR